MSNNCQKCVTITRRPSIEGEADFSLQRLHNQLKRFIIAAPKERKESHTTNIALVSSIVFSPSVMIHRRMPSFFGRENLVGSRLYSIPLINPHNPNNPPFHEAMSSPDADKWTQGIQEELESLKEMGVYKLIPHSDVPAGRKILRGKWVLHLKRDEHRNPVRYKACFVVKGFEQVFGQDYVDTTSPTARMESVHLLLNIAVAKDWDLHRLMLRRLSSMACYHRMKHNIWNSLPLSQSLERKIGSGVFNAVCIV
jgi:hypothetical protein